MLVYLYAHQDSTHILALRARNFGSDFFALGWAGPIGQASPTHGYCLGGNPLAHRNGPIISNPVTLYICSGFSEMFHLEDGSQRPLHNVQRTLMEVYHCHIIEMRKNKMGRSPFVHRITQVATE